MRLETKELAEPRYKRALQINEKTFGPEHPSVARTLSNLSALYDRQGRYAQAIEPIRRASAIYGGRAPRSGIDQSGEGVIELKTFRFIFLRHAGIALRLLAQPPPTFNTDCRKF